MSGTENDQPKPDLPPVDIPPSPELPPLPWEEKGDSGRQADAAAPASPAGQAPPAAQTQQGGPRQAAPPAAAVPAHGPAAPPADPYAARAEAVRNAPQGSDPYAAAAAQPGQAGYPGQPGYGPQPGYLPAPPPKKRRNWVGAAIAVGLVVVLGGGYLLGNQLHWFDGRSGEEGGESADVPLAEAAPGDLAFAWNTEGVSDDGWSFTYQDADGFEATKGGQECSFVGYSTAIDAVNPEAGDAADDAEASAADFQAYIDALGDDPAVKSQDVEEAGTVAIGTPQGTVEFQAYNVNLNWTDRDTATTKERWYWRSFVDSDVAMQAYVSCGSENISDEIESLRELTVD